MSCCTQKNESPTKRSSILKARRSSSKNSGETDDKNTDQTEEGKPLNLIGDKASSPNSIYQTGSSNGWRESSVIRRVISMDPKEPRGWCSVILRRSPGVQSLGLGLAGGADKEFPPIISCLRAGSLAHRSDAIQVGDFLVGVNGIKVGYLSHNEILTLLRNAGEMVRLDLEYNLNEMYFNKPAGTYSKATDIQLDKEGGSFGFTIRGGAYGPDPKKSRPITVTAVRPGGPADREGRLRVGDRVLSINGIDVYSATLTAAAKMLGDVRNTVSITVEYDISILETLKGASGPLLLEIDKPPGAELGLKLFLEDSRPNRHSLLIQEVIPASIADRCGALHCGNELIGIDGVSLDYTTIAEARQLLRGSSQNGQIKLEIIPHSQGRTGRGFSRDRSRHSRTPLDSDSRDDFNDRNSGWSRQSSCEPERGRRMDSVGQDSNDGGGRRGGSKRGTPSRQLTANSTRRKSERRCSQSQERTSFSRNSRRKSSRDRSLGPLQEGREAQTQAGGGHLLAERGYPLEFNSEPSLEHTKSGSLQLILGGPSEFETVRERSRQRSNYNKESHGSLSASVSGVPCGQVCHSEVMEVSLHSWARGGFGLILHRSQASVPDPSRAPLFISYIERGSPAEKSGVLQVGDRVLAINDWCTANGTSDEANYIIRHAASPLALTVEFDVIETVLPSSGIFTVKLAKRGQNLGVVISTSGSLQKGEPVLVSDIRTGSVAHRCGSIHPGDQLLGIDNIPLDSCTVEEAIRLLHHSSDIVKLRVKKSSAFANDEAEPPQTVVYSVELSRRGGPLGITIASTDERGDPIIISQLAQGGLADRTGALHIGDRIVAVNSQSLQGKSVSEAMQLLQQTGDAVTLKIARCVDPPIPYQHAHPRGYGMVLDGRGMHSTYSDNYGDHEGGDKMGTPVQSIDSAVESLEDSPIADPANHHSHHTNRNSTNSKTSSIAGDQANKYAEELSVHLERSLTTLSKGGPGISQQHQSYSRSVEVGSVADSGVGSSDAGTSANGDPFCGCSCQQTHYSTNHGQQEDWMRVLEALETVGEAEMLKKLEESIMTGSVPSSFDSSLMTNSSSSMKQAKNSSPLNPPFPTTNTILRHPHMSHTTSRPLSGSTGSLHSSDSGATGGTGGSGGHSSAPVPPPKPPHPYSVPSRSGPLTISTMHKSSESIPYITSPLDVSMTDKNSNHQQQRQGGFAGNLVTVNTSTSNPYVDASVINGRLVPASASGGATPRDGSSTPSSIQLSGGTLTPSVESQLMAAADATVASESLSITSTTSSASTSAPTALIPLEVYRVTLFKDRANNDFGFSVSDGFEKKGIFINLIRPGGPADLSGSIKPYDRVIQVNGTNVEQMDCMLAVPLLQAASDRLDLLIQRDPTARFRPESIEEEDENESVITTGMNEVTV